MVGTAVEFCALCDVPPLLGKRVILDNVFSHMGSGKITLTKNAALAAVYRTVRTVRHITAGARKGSALREQVVFGFSVQYKYRDAIYSRQWGILGSRRVLHLQQ